MSAVAEFVQEVSVLGRQQKEQADKVYRQLVRNVLDGQPGAAADATAILKASDKTTADLAADVEKLRIRRDKFDKVQQIPGLRAEIAKLEQIGIEADRELEAAKKSHKQAKEQLQPRLTELQNKIGVWAAYESDLFSTCDDPEFLRRNNELGRRLALVNQEKIAISDQLKPYHHDFPHSVGRRWHALKQQVGTAAEPIQSRVNAEGGKLSDARIDAAKESFSVAQKELAAFEKANVQPLQNKLAMLDKQLATIQIEQRELAIAAMEP